MNVSLCMQFVSSVCVYLFELIFTKDVIVFLIVYIYDTYCKMLAMKLILTKNLARKPIPIFPKYRKMNNFIYIFEKWKLNCGEKY